MIETDNDLSISEIELGLMSFLPSDRIRTRYIDRASFASDAGFYHLVPKAIVQPIAEQEIIDLFKFSRKNSIPIVFRAGGTSLSGQAITDGILVDLSQFWNQVNVIENGNLVRVQPGVTGAMVNVHLRRFGRKIGPDPSSISAAMMGGILSNNASGMCCGVSQNSYHTTQFIRFILPNGQTYSTELPGDYDRFENESYELFQTLKNIREQLKADAILSDSIRNKYKTKTTIGYSLNAFIDYSHPLDILAHLLIGAEGTLAFISEAVLQTVPDYPFKSTALLYFDNIYTACQAIKDLASAGAQMIELMDRASLRAIQDLPEMPECVKSVPKEGAALLVEFQGETANEVTNRVETFLEGSERLSLLNEPIFTMDAARRAFLWKIRKGLFPAVGAVRASGTTVILEDIAFPVEKLGDAILDLQALFIRYQYDNAIIFGHAKDGNIHFVITQSFNTLADIDRYDRFLREVVELVVAKYHGTLKAEHGTGRNMAPFVQTELGPEAYIIMQRLKQVIDPLGLLNPGVIISDNPQAHITHLKKLPKVETEVDRCIECGYCEHKCPSRNLTMTPRRRIVARRALKILEEAGDTDNFRRLKKQYQYDGLETCAVDGLCATACPVDINTGDLVKRLRQENHSLALNRLALLAAKNPKLVERLARIGVHTGHILNCALGSKLMATLTKNIRRISPSFPQWSDQIGAPPDLSTLRGTQELKMNDPMLISIVYMPACISRLMGTYSGKNKSLHEIFLSICAKTNVQVVIPKVISGLCCSQIFSSKGYQDAYKLTANRTIEHIWNSSFEGLLPVVIDVSSCAYSLRNVRSVLSSANQAKFDNLKIQDTVDFLYQFILPNAQPKQLKGDIVLHSVCSLEKMGTQSKFIDVAQKFANTVTIPKSTGCCGMAGDRGFLFPELTQSATRAEASEVHGRKYDGYYSTTKTCEIALSEAVGQSYEALLYLVDECL